MCTLKFIPLPLDQSFLGLKLMGASLSLGLDKKSLQAHQTWTAHYKPGVCKARALSPSNSNKEKITFLFFIFLSNYYE